MSRQEAIGTTDAATRELERVRNEAQIELRWWEHQIVDLPILEEDMDPPIGFQRVAPEGYGYRLIGPLRDGKEPAMLRDPAHALLLHISAAWLAEAESAGLDPGVLLSVSSLYRNRALQESLIEGGCDGS